MTASLHKRLHHVSHFQISLINAGANLTEFDVGCTLVNFASQEINVTTAWDENGTVPPEVEIEVSGFDMPPLEGFAPLFPVATSTFEVGNSGIEVGNWISNDVAKVAVPKGLYKVLVSLDVLEPAKARRVHFHFWKA
jgi:hypothetical protein